MRSARLLLLAVLLTGCAFEEPPAPSAGVSEAPAVPASAEPVGDACTDIAITLLDGQLNGLPSAEPTAFDKANRVVAQFVQRYDAVIATAGVEAARAQYTDEIRAACAG